MMDSPTRKGRSLNQGVKPTAPGVATGDMASLRPWTWVRPTATYHAGLATTAADPTDLVWIQPRAWGEFDSSGLNRQGAGRQKKWFFPTLADGKMNHREIKWLAHMATNGSQISEVLVQCFNRKNIPPLILMFGYLWGCLQLPFIRPFFLRWWHCGYSPVRYVDVFQPLSYQLLQSN